MRVSSIHDRDGYVELQTQGDYLPGDPEELLRSALEATSRKDGSRLLLDLRGLTDAQLQTVDRYKMGTAAARLPKGVRLAVLMRPEVIDPQRFGIQVARNRGAVADLFDDEKRALAWLLRQDDPAEPAKPT